MSHLNLTGPDAGTATTPPPRVPLVHPAPAGDLAARLAHSATATGGEVMSDLRFFDWLDERRRGHGQQVRRTTFAELSGWHFAPGTGDLEHRSGRFFAVRGLRVRTDFGPVREWRQPIIQQPEIGILGIAVREIGGVLHCLLQAKSEPGNVNGVQLSPTVQATKSNYTRVHGGSSVPYLDCFREPRARGHRVLADVLQSEQGSWFLRKRNRNMVVEVGPEVEAGEDFCWLTLRQIGLLLRYENLVNMDARTVLSCLPDWQHGPATADDVAADVALRSWITGQRSERELDTELLTLPEVEGHGWQRAEDRISHERGLFFSIVPVDVVSGRREVASWSQPLLEPHGTGTVAMLVRRIGGVPHCLMQARVEAGYLDVVELGPTVQCTPGNYAHLPPGSRPRFLDVVQGARPERVLYDTVLSEEGGRFLHAQNRYLIVAVDDIDVPDERGAARDSDGAGDPSGQDTPPDFRWVSLRQLGELLRHGHYVNVQARTLVAALRTVPGLAGPEPLTASPAPGGTGAAGRSGAAPDGGEGRADHR
ncbi:NDP-hexose 2,3-dehydratase family protein [Streptomyces heilongjiangensis]|uniref:NDP-hexose 2,3-dehydratase family protein n=1 Tax=Streptomyces heilongjiangensis TaxID=945052 RepID=A0ABW1BIF1_9ACTN|nr:NDP-hexose 2,3-dehydratase family protein [Streptomyces heilongjiangensis]MDC2951812.1 NDP-hexose 2,3-dehydratase family protein [Streptomyces heilongjiangensis]